MTNHFDVQSKTPNSKINYNGKLQVLPQAKVLCAVNNSCVGKFAFNEVEFIINKSQELDCLLLKIHSKHVLCKSRLQWIPMLLQCSEEGNVPNANLFVY